VASLKGSNRRKRACGFALGWDIGVISWRRTEHLRFGGTRVDEGGPANSYLCLS
jgi:hypothetical protein